MDDDYMLTTYDNPFNPFTEFDIWWKMDHLLRHNCCEILANETSYNKAASDEVNDHEILLAMDRIVEREPMIYRKVLAKDYKSVAAN